MYKKALRVTMCTLLLLLTIGYSTSFASDLIINVEIDKFVETLDGTVEVYPDGVDPNTAIPGENNQIFVGYDNGFGMDVGVIRFDLNAIDSNRTIKSATLNFFIIENVPNNFITIYGSLYDTWTENDTIIPSEDYSIVVGVNNYGTSSNKVQYDVTDFIKQRASSSNKASFVISGPQSGNGYITFPDRGNPQYQSQNYKTHLEIEYETTPPTGTVSINSDEAYTNTTNVTLNLSANATGGGPIEMRLSNDNVNWSSWEVFSPTKAWILSTGDGEKTVYVQLKDSEDNLSSNEISDSIILNTGPPVGTIAQMVLSQDITAPTVNGGAFSQQPIIELQDAYGNICIDDNTTEITVSKKGLGNWTLTGTTTATANNGIVTFTNLRATNGAITNAQLTFNTTGLEEITSAPVILPAPAGSHAATANAYYTTPDAGQQNLITFYVQDALGNTDIAFTGAKNVTITGVEVAPNGSYGSFGGIVLNADSAGAGQVISVSFGNGVSTPWMTLNKATAQTIGFSIEGVTTPQTNSLTITPRHSTVANMEIKQDITAPTVNGGAFVQQPVITLIDAYGNICIDDNTTEITVEKKDGGAWSLTGTTTVTVNNGIATFTNLGATNIAEVNGVQLAFSTVGLVEVTSSTVTLPLPVPTFRVTYDGNGNTGGNVPVDNNSYESGANVLVLVPEGGFIKTDHSFEGWNTQADGYGSLYHLGTIFAMPAENITFYAEWTANPIYTVTDQEKITADKATLGISYAAGDNAASVSQNINLPRTGAVYGSDITWTSDNESIIKINTNGNTGLVTRPVSGSGDGHVTVTAAVYYNGASDTKDFNLTVLQLQPPASQKVTMSISKTDVTTYGGTNGSITITAYGGSGSYEYSRDNGTTWQDSNEFKGLSTGTYRVLARDRADTSNESTVSTLTITSPDSSSGGSSGGGGGSSSGTSGKSQDKQQQAEGTEDINRAEDSQEASPPRKKILLTIGNQDITIGNETYQLDAMPFIDGETNRTLVPLRFISETLGAKVTWLPETRQVLIIEGDTEILLTIDSKEILVNGEIILIDTEPRIIPPGRTFVPLRFISEVLGATVAYDEATREISIEK